MTICRVDECDRHVTGRGLCRKHYLREWKAGAFVDVPLASRKAPECPAGHPHDLDTCWADHGCRCNRCQHLRRMDRQRRRVRLRAYGRGDRIAPPRVPVQPVYDHVVWLQGQGFGLERIADAAQVSRSSVMYVYYGPRGRNAQGHRDISKRTIQESLAKRILSLTPEQISGAFVPSLGTVRRLRALVSIGYTESFLAENLGMNVGNLSRVLLDPRPRVTSVTYEAVSSLFSSLWAVPQVGRHAGIARRVAERHRWVGPLAWDDIDDPDERPNVSGDSDVDTFDETAVELAMAGQRVKLTPAERREAITRLHARRWSDQLIASTIHCMDRTVLRIRGELGLEAFDFEDLVKVGAA